MALKCADAPLRNYSLSYFSVCKDNTSNNMTINHTLSWVE